MDQKDDVERTLPHAISIEKSVLSLMLQDTMEYASRAIEAGITADHFYMPAHRILFMEAVAALEKGEAIEMVSFIQSLNDKGKLSGLGGPSAVVDIIGYEFIGATFERHIETLKEKFVLRSLIRCCMQTIDDAYSSPGESGRVLDEAEKNILKIRESSTTITTQATSKELMATLIIELQDALNGKPLPQGLRTGFDELDRITGGLRPGEMFVIGARPSMGKTALMMNIAEMIAVEAEVPTLVFTAEMTKETLAKRQLYGRAKFDQKRIHGGERPSKGELAKIKHAAVAISSAKIFYDDRARPALGYIRSRARRLKREHDIGLVVIDYLGLIKSDPGNRQQSEEREISEISSGIKAMAKELGIHVILLAQLNRKAEDRGGREDRGRPRMSDLKGSGGIEADADIIGLLYREEYYAQSEEDKKQVEGRAMLDIAKNRNGATGPVYLTFIKQFTKFESGSPAPSPQPEQSRRW